jgi:hypothetical protein
LWWLVGAVATLVVVALEVSELALSSYLRFNRIRSLLVLAAQLMSTAVILYFLPLHQQVVVAVRLVVRLTAAVLAAAARIAVALVRLEIRLLHLQVKVTLVVMVALEVAAEEAVLVQQVAMRRVLT